MKGEIMSFDRYKKACSLIESFDDFECCGGRGVEEIAIAEKLLGKSFSKQYKDFLEKYDYSSFEGVEIFGITGGSEAKVLEGNIVAYTLNDREHLNLRNEWLPFYNFGDGSLGFFDYSVINAEGEPRVICAYYDGNSYVMVEEIAEDFGDFLYELAQMLL